jgi:hypothetical protein
MVILPMDAVLASAGALRKHFLKSALDIYSRAAGENAAGSDQLMWPESDKVFSQGIFNEEYFARLLLHVLSL